MKRILIFTVLFLAGLGGVYSPAQVSQVPAMLVTGAVSSVNRGEVRITQAAGGRPNTTYINYVFSVTNKTLIGGIVTRGALVTVKYHRQDLRQGFILIADEIQVIRPANPYYPIRY